MHKVINKLGVNMLLKLKLSSEELASTMQGLSMLVKSFPVVVGGSVLENHCMHTQKKKVGNHC